MAVKKFALSVPEDVMKEVDRAAKRFGVTRSRFISGVLRRVSDARSDEEITRRARNSGAPVSRKPEPQASCSCSRPISAHNHNTLRTLIDDGLPSSLSIG